MSDFTQTPPTLTNTYQSDTSLRLHLKRQMGDALGDVEAALDDLGERAAGEMLEWARDAEQHPPTLTHYGPYGRRIDRIDLSAGWKAISKVAAETGLVDIPHAQAHGWRSRVHQFAMLNVFSPSSAYVCCPLAMSDGAVTALKAYGDGEYATRAIAHLTSRDPDQAWTSGQWMTEKEGGSDVGRSSTVARQDSDGTWRLYGTKYFTSATTSQCTLTLARPEGAGPGSRGLSLFYLEPWRADGTLNRIKVRRLKDKLGTKALPTAELELEGALAYPVGGLERGIPKITKVLNIARYFNVSGAVSSMRRCVDMAVAYARVREAFGKRLIDQPLHLETLAAMQVEYDAALAVGIRLSELLGKVEAGVATDLERATWRLLTPLAKLGTGKQVVALASETLEAFGGAGYVEDTGVPVLLRDAQVLPIWEGTTNVLSLDALRAIRRDDALEAFLADAAGAVKGLDTSNTPLAEPARRVLAALRTLGTYAAGAAQSSPEAIQTGARAFALGLYRTYAAAQLCAAARWEAEHATTTRLTAAAQRWTAQPLASPLSADAQRAAASRALIG